MGQQERQRIYPDDQHRAPLLAASGWPAAEPPPPRSAAVALTCYLAPACAAGTAVPEIPNQQLRGSAASHTSPLSPLERGAPALLAR